MRNHECNNKGAMTVHYGVCNITFPRVVITLGGSQIHVFWGVQNDHLLDPKHGIDHIQSHDLQI